MPEFTSKGRLKECNITILVLVAPANSLEEVPFHPNQAGKENVLCPMESQAEPQVHVYLQADKHTSALVER